MQRLGKRTVFTEANLRKATEIVGKLSYRDPLLMALSVLLAGRLKLTGEQIASVLGVSKSTVVRMNERFRHLEEQPDSRWGGDRRSILDEKTRREVLDGLADEAAAGKIVIAERVKAAIEEKRGASVSLQTAYNLLHRAGWRKVRPDKQHPQGDRAKQEEFKKKPSRRPWHWLPPKRRRPGDRCG
jgi:transposase